MQFYILLFLQTIWMDILKILCTQKSSNRYNNNTMDMVKENQFTGMDNVTITCSFGDSREAGSLTSGNKFASGL